MKILGRFWIFDLYLCEIIGRIIGALFYIILIKIFEKLLLYLVDFDLIRLFFKITYVAVVILVLIGTLESMIRCINNNISAHRKENKR